MANFSSEVIRLAQETEKRYGVPASVTLAQYALESGYGTSNLAAKGNNYFGITGSYNGQSVELSGRNWRKYDSMAQSFEDHGRLLTTGRYAAATQGMNNAFDYVDAIAEIYAPSSDGNAGYAGKLKSIITTNNLTQYDGGGGSGGLSVNLNPVNYVQDKAGDVLATVIRLVVMAGLVVLAMVFFLNAFDLHLPSVKNVTEAVAE